MSHLPQLCDGSVKLGFPKCRGLSFFSKFEKIDLYKVNLDSSQTIIICSWLFLFSIAKKDYPPVNSHSYAKSQVS